jgi:hypothetical protein
VICTNDGGSVGNFSGPYAWCGGIGKAFGITNIGAIPDVNTPPYNMPNYGPCAGPCSIQDFWPLEEYAHELGHVMAGHHTHCVAIGADSASTPDARTTVDTCYNNEGVAGCVSGVPPGKVCDGFGYCSPAPAEKGTIMSYCHNVKVGLTPQSRYTFGQASEVSRHELDDWMLNASGPNGSTAVNRQNIVTGTAAMTMNSFTVPASVTPLSIGNTASITTTGASTFTWDIVNGTITSGQGTQSITFTAGSSGTVTLTPTAFNATKCGIRDTKTVAIAAATFNPPTGLVATYDGVVTVNLSWTAPTTGTAPVQYDVYRTDFNDYTHFVGLGVTPGTTFSDGSVSLNQAYLYKVRSAGALGANESADSNLDLATIVVYTNPVLTAGSSLITATDLSQLEGTVNVIRVLAKVGTFSFPTVTAGVTAVSASDLTTMRTKLQEAFTKMSLGTISFVDPINAGSTQVKGQHFTELRTKMQ